MGYGLSSMRSAPLVIRIIPCLDTETTQMARQASSKPADSTAAIGSKLSMRSFGLRHSGFDILDRVHLFIHHLAPQTALRDSAFLKCEAIPQVVSAAKDNTVALPGQLFDITQFPVCLWFLAKNKAADAKRGFRDRQERSQHIGGGKLCRTYAQIPAIK